MNVKLLNPEDISKILEGWGNFARTCYNTSEGVPNEKIGKHCLESGHFSGSRSRYIEFLITDCPRFLIDQLIRSEVGTCKNVQSFRYVSKDNFSYEIPSEILDNDELVREYIAHMEDTVGLYDKINFYVMMNTGSVERANEQSRYVLPMSTHGSVAIGMTIESFINLCHKRLCVRSEDLQTLLVSKMRDLVNDIEPEFKPYLVPQCNFLTWCPEKKSCGRYPKKGV